MFKKIACLILGIIAGGALVFYFYNDIQGYINPDQKQEQPETTAALNSGRTASANESEPEIGATWTSYFLHYGLEGITQNQFRCTFTYKDGAHGRKWYYTGKDSGYFGFDSQLPSPYAGADLLKVENCTVCNEIGHNACIYTDIDKSGDSSYWHVYYQVSGVSQLFGDGPTRENPVECRWVQKYGTEGSSTGLMFVEYEKDRVPVGFWSHDGALEPIEHDGRWVIFDLQTAKAWRGTDQYVTFAPYNVVEFYSFRTGILDGDGNDDYTEYLYKTQKLYPGDAPERPKDPPAPEGLGYGALDYWENRETHYKYSAGVALPAPSQELTKYYASFRTLPIYSGRFNYIDENGLPAFQIVYSAEGGTFTPPTVAQSGNLAGWDRTDFDNVTEHRIYNAVYSDLTIKATLNDAPAAKTYSAKFQTAAEAYGQYYALFNPSASADEVELTKLTFEYLFGQEAQRYGYYFPNKFEFEAVQFLNLFDTLPADSRCNGVLYDGGDPVYENVLVRVSSGFRLDFKIAELRYLTVKNGVTGEEQTLILNDYKTEDGYYIIELPLTKPFFELKKLTRYKFKVEGAEPVGFDGKKAIIFKVAVKPDGVYAPVTITYTHEANIFEQAGDWIGGAAGTVGGWFKNGIGAIFGDNGLIHSLGDLVGNIADGLGGALSGDWLWILLIVAGAIILGVILFNIFKGK